MIRRRDEIFLREAAEGHLRENISIGLFLRSMRWGSIRLSTAIITIRRVWIFVAISRQEISGCLDVLSEDAKSFGGRPPFGPGPVQKAMIAKKGETSFSLLLPNYHGIIVL